jgi:hypothetical protein
VPPPVTEYPFTLIPMSATSDPKKLTLLENDLSSFVLAINQSNEVHKNICVSLSTKVKQNNSFQICERLKVDSLILIKESQ